MHFHKRTLLSVATLGMLAVSVVLMVVWVRNSNHSSINTNEFLCTTRTVTTIQPKDIHADGSLVLDFKMKRITLQYEIKTKDNGVKILYRDVYMKKFTSNSAWCLYVRSIPGKSLCHGHGWRSVIIFTGSASGSG
ncbi:membrane protein [Salmonella enterica subsp. enterica]|nr:membrane protein [Salmonella enterica subsp. enterica] [Salmonella enterica subsp. enterica serovar Menston]